MAQDVVVPLKAEQASLEMLLQTWLRKHVGDSYSHSIQGFWLVDYDSGILVGWFSRRTFRGLVGCSTLVPPIWNIYARSAVGGFHTPRHLPPLLLCTEQFCTRSASQLIRICFFHRTLLTGAKSHSRYDHSIQRTGRSTFHELILSSRRLWRTLF